MSPAYTSANEQAIHLKAIKLLAHEYECPFERVKRAYELEFDRLQTGAKLRDYLPVLVARRVRQKLNEGGLRP